MTWHRLHKQCEWRRCLTLRWDRSVYWLSVSTQFGVFVLVYTGRCAGVELTPVGDSLRAYLRFGLVQCYWQHSLTSNITSRRIWLMHKCVFLYMLHREDQCMHFTSKARTILAFPHKEIYQQCSLFLLVFFLICPRKVKSPLASVITLSVNESMVRRSFWGNAELSTSLFACYWFFPSTCMSCSLSSD